MENTYNMPVTKACQGMAAAIAYHRIIGITFSVTWLIRYVVWKQTIYKLTTPHTARHCELVDRLFSQCLALFYFTGSQTGGRDPKREPQMILWGPQMISLMKVFCFSLDSRAVAVMALIALCNITDSNCNGETLFLFLFVRQYLYQDTLLTSMKTRWTIKYS